MGFLKTLGRAPWSNAFCLPFVLQAKFLRLLASRAWRESESCGVGSADTEANYVGDWFNPFSHVRIGLDQKLSVSW